MSWLHGMSFHIASVGKKLQKRRRKDCCYCGKTTHAAHRAWSYSPAFILLALLPGVNLVSLFLASSPDQGYDPLCMAGHQTACQQQSSE